MQFQFNCVGQWWTRHLGLRLHNLLLRVSRYSCLFGGAGLHVWPLFHSLLPIRRSSLLSAQFKFLKRLARLTHSKVSNFGRTISFRRYAFTSEILSILKLVYRYFCPNQCLCLNADVIFVPGWVSTIGWNANSAAGVFFGATMIQGLLVLNDSTYDAPRWQGTLLMYAALFVVIFVNTLGSKLLPKIEGSVTQTEPARHAQT